MTPEQIRATRLAFLAVEDSCDEMVEAFARLAPVFRRAALRLPPPKGGKTK